MSVDDDGRRDGDDVGHGDRGRASVRDGERWRGLWRSSWGRWVGTGGRERIRKKKEGVERINGGEWDNRACIGVWLRMRWVREWKTQAGNYSYLFREKKAKWTEEETGRCRQRCLFQVDVCRRVTREDATTLLLAWSLNELFVLFFFFGKLYLSKQSKQSKQILIFDLFVCVVVYD